MSKPNDRIDEALLSVGKEQLTSGEAEALWARIEAEMSEEPPVVEAERSDSPRPRRLRSGGVLGASVAVAAVLIAVVLVGPWTKSDDSDGPLNLAGLSTASAAEVLGVTADAARENQSFVPGPGEVFFATEQYFYIPTKEVKESFPNPVPDGPLPMYEKEFWIGPDGKGLEVQRLPGMNYPGKGDEEWGDVVHMGTDWSRIGPDPEGGVEWFNAFTTDDLKELPTDPGAVIETIRKANDRAAEVIGHWEKFSQAGRGKNLSTLEKTFSLLSTAPLTGEQRAALFEVIVSAPDWYRSDGRADASTENLGTAETVAGREGIAIRVVTGPDPRVEKFNREAGIDDGYSGDMYMDIVVDPEEGRVLELQQGKVGEPPSSWVTYERIELRDLEDMPPPDRR